MGGTDLLGGEEAGFLHWLPRGLRFVVETFAAPVGAGGVTGGLLRRGEEVQPHRDQRPELAQQRELCGGVIPPVERVLADDVVILRFHGGLVVLLVGA